MQDSNSSQHKQSKRVRERIDAIVINLLVGNGDLSYGMSKTSAASRCASSDIYTPEYSLNRTSSLPTCAIPNAMDQFMRTTKEIGLTEAVGRPGKLICIKCFCFCSDFVIVLWFRTLSQTGDVNIRDYTISQNLRQMNGVSMIDCAADLLWSLAFIIDM